MEKQLYLIVVVMVLVSLSATAAVEVTTPEGRTVRLNDDRTWEYVDTSDDPDMTYAVLSVVKKQSLSKGCRFGLKLQNDLGFKIKSLVPQFSAFKAGNVLYETVSRGFSEIKPTNSQYREILFSRIACHEIEFVKVHGADRCTMGPYTKFTPEKGACLERIKVNPNDRVRILK